MLIKFLIKKNFYPIYFILKNIYKFFIFLKFTINSFVYKNFYNYKKNEKLTSPSNLIYLEKKYLGLQTNVRRNVVSEFDPRTKKELRSGGMTGGDKMFHHNYNKVYSQFLSKIDLKKKLNIVEIGILNGSGIAVFSEIFKNAQIFGLDIDVSNFYKNYKTLKKLGAFRIKPLIYKYDQFKNNTLMLKKIFFHKKLDIVIDDGFHSDETILNSFEEMKPFFNKNFIYFIEDNSTCFKILKKKYHYYNIHKFSLMTVITNK